VKHRDLIRLIRAKGAVFVRHGGEHDIYRQPRTGKTAAVPRHREIAEPVARGIIKSLS